MYFTGVHIYCVTTTLSSQPIEVTIPLPPPSGTKGRSRGGRQLHAMCTETISTVYVCPPFYNLWIRTHTQSQCMQVCLDSPDGNWSSNLGVENIMPREVTLSWSPDNRLGTIFYVVQFREVNLTDFNTSSPVSVCMCMFYIHICMCQNASFSHHSCMNHVVSRHSDCDVILYFVFVHQHNQWERWRCINVTHIR